LTNLESSVDKAARLIHKDLTTLQVAFTGIQFASLVELNIGSKTEETVETGVKSTHAFGTTDRHVGNFDTSKFNIVQVDAGINTRVAIVDRVLMTGRNGGL
jgi:pyrimidine operon attenuation protein/uracil phosphoribosyltransferase